jgi:hypothetical protein
MSDIAVIVDPLMGTSPASEARREALARALGRAAEVVLCPDEEALGRAVSRLSGRSLWGVTGADAGLSAVMTALWRAERWPGALLPMGGEGWDQARRGLGVKGGEEEVAARLARAVARGGGLRRVEAATLRVSCSAREGASLGFCFGLGALTALAQEQALGGGLRAAARGLWSAREAVSLRARADEEALPGSLWLLAASSWGELPARLRAPAASAGSLRVLWATQASGAAALALPVPVKGEHHGARRAARLALDLPAGLGWTLDGALVEGAAGGMALLLQPGPVVTLAAL